MAKIELSSKANNSPAENLFTPIVLLLGIVFAIVGIKLKWFRHRLTFNSSESNTPTPNSENTNQVFGVYKRNEIDERDFRARMPDTVPSTYSVTGNQHGQSSASHYKAVKVNNQIKLIPPAPAYTPPTIHQGNIKTTELRVDFNNNNNNGPDAKSSAKATKQPKYIRVKKEEHKKMVAASSKAGPAPQPIQKPVQQIAPSVHVVQTHNNKPKAATPLLVPPKLTLPPPQAKSQPSTVKQEVKTQPPVIVPITAPSINPLPPPYSSPAVIEIENPAMAAKLNSMPTTFIQLNDFDLTESNDIPPPTIRVVNFHDEYNAERQFAYNDALTIKPSSSQNRNMTYNDKIEIVTETNGDDLFQKMKPTPRTTGINYLEYQSTHNNQNNKADDNSESKFNDNDDDDSDYELAPLEFLSKTTTTTTTNAAATVKNETIQIHTKTTSTATPTTTTNTSNRNKDERKNVVDDSSDDNDDDNSDADNDNMWDLVANHRKNVGRQLEWDQSVNVNEKLKKNQRTMMNASIAATDKPKTLRELHSQSRENNRKTAAAPIKPTSKSNAFTFSDLDDEADA